MGSVAISSGSLRARIGQLLESCEVEAGERVVTQGDAARSLYIVVAGQPPRAHRVGGQRRRGGAFDPWPPRYLWRAGAPGRPAQIGYRPGNRGVIPADAATHRLPRVASLGSGADRGGARVAGASRADVNEILRSFEHLGYLAFDDDDVERNLITVRDVGTLRRQVSEGLSWSELAEKVFHDPLTKLANRVLDTVARLGGDEFAILLADSGSVGDAMAIAKRVLAAMHEPFATPEGDTHVGASVGISVFGDGNRVLAEGLLEQADAAMYAAKISGTNRFVVHGGEPEERTLADRRVDVERRWR